MKSRTVNKTTTVTVNQPTRTFSWPLYQKPSLWRRILRYLRG